ncbi:MAG: Transcriptional regulator, LysR family [Hyphomicrobiales bacterium]|nr:Transcriptional regulator, LysR family [Hyphomicrobiales bacterium]
MDRLKAIETFVRIAQTGSLSKAAQELGMSRALASTHLRQLEDHLGARLLNRTTRQLSLTEAGQEYLTFGQTMLAAFDEAEQSITRSRYEPRGTLKILASMAFANVHLAPMAAEFSGLHPDIRISLIMTDTSFSPFDLIEQGYDLAVWMHAIEDMSIISTKLGEVRWPALASPAYLETHARPEHPAELAGHPCLLHRSISPDSTWRFDGPGGQVAVKVAGPLFTNSVYALRASALAGLGVTLLPSYFIEEDLASGKLVQIFQDYEPPRRPIYVLYPHGRYLPLKSRLFIDHLRAYVRRQKW